MALTLVHDDFKTLIDNVTGLSAYPQFIEENAEYPAMAYSMEGVARDIDSNQSRVSISAHVFTVYVVDTSFKETQQLAQTLINAIDLYVGGNFLRVLVEDCSDDYDPQRDLHIKALTVSVRVRE